MDVFTLMWSFLNPFSNKWRLLYINVGLLKDDKAF
jgi:hypothetical protein